MKKRPLIVLLFAGACVIYPVLAIVQILLTHKIGVGQAVSTFVWPSLPLLFRAENLAATGLAWVAAYTIYQMKAWSWWFALLAVLGLAAYGGMVSLFRTENLGTAWAVTSAIITALPALAAGILLQREVRTPYFNPRIRWWEAEPRYPFDAQVRGGGRALDISQKGMFVQHEDPPKMGTRDTFMFAFDGGEVSVPGEVSWVSEGDAAHPSGFGLEFGELDEATRKVIDEIVEQQRRLGGKEWGERALRYPTDLRCADDGVVLDISLGGMFVQSSDKRTLGDTRAYRLRFGRHDLEVSGQVVWISRGQGVYPPGYGVRFVSKDRDTREMIRLVIQDLWRANLEPVKRQP